MAKRKFNEVGVQLLMMAAKSARFGARDVDDAHWRLDAACRDTDPESFFPTTVDDAVVPKKLCRKCRVQAECFADRQPWGIWGGTTEWDRQQWDLRPPCPASGG